MNEHVSKRHAARHHKKISIAKQVFLLGLSFILISAAIVLFSVFGINHIYNMLIDSEIGMIFASNPDTQYSDNVGENIPKIDLNTIKKDDGSLNIDKFPNLKWGDQWATISIPDTDCLEVPVFVGDNDSILKLGVGKLYGSYFPGEVGNIVLSAHVNRSFYCLQDLEIGHKVILNTVWGEYVYEIERTEIFDYDNPNLLLQNDGTETLICYTCYPRGVAFRTQRYAIICKKVSGGDWK